MDKFTVIKNIFALFVRSYFGPFRIWPGRTLGQNPSYEG